MKILQVPFLKTISTETSIAKASQLLETSSIGSTAIDCLNWPDEFPEKPTVRFKVVRIVDGLLIKFYVEEKYTSATLTCDNQPVYKDSCVELFIDPSSDGTYYNFEFNAIGTLLLGFGTNRHHREKALPEITKQIKRFSSLGTLPFNSIINCDAWDLTVMIPYSAFWKHTVRSLEEKSIKANFQKCGDDLVVPHYLTWNPIPTLHPDYHLPEFFGILEFI